MRIEWHPAAADELAALDATVQVRIVRILQQKVIDAAEPALEPFHGDLKGFHKVRVGSYRLVCRLRGTEDLVTVLLVAHRSDIFPAAKIGCYASGARRTLTLRSLACGA